MDVTARVAAVLVAIGMVGLGAGRAAAQLDVTFTKVADTSTPTPGGSGNLETFFAAVVEHGEVAFRATAPPATASPGANGIFRATGGSLSLVVDELTSLPGGGGRFVLPQDPSLSAPDVAFLNDSFFFGGSIYVARGGSFDLVADDTTSIPGGSGSFTRIFKPSLADGAAAFRAFGASLQEGIYLGDGVALQVIADRNTPPPGNAPAFIDFWDPFVDGGDVAFTVRRSGVYIGDGASLQVVADVDTPIPDGTGTFEGFIGVVLDGGDVAFLGERGVRRGLYTTAGGALRRVADGNTPIPNGAGTFGIVSVPALDGGTVAFWGGSATTGITGIYVDLGGSLFEIVRRGDTLDGKTIDLINFEREGLSGNQVVFTVWFTDGSQGVFVATFAEPSAVPALGPSALAVTALLMALAATAGLLRRG